MADGRYRLQARLVTLAALAACTPQISADPAAVEAHRAEVLAWQQKREQGLRDPTGWLTLAGLSWLSPGERSIGSDPQSAVVLPAPVPPRLGVLQVADGAVTLRLDPPAVGAPPVSIDGRGPAPAVTPLVDDMKPDGPTVIVVDTVRFLIIERGGRLGVRIKDKNSRALAEFHGIERYPIDYRWRIAARFQPDPQDLQVANVLGGETREHSPGWLSFELEGAPQRLRALEEDGELFIVFADATNRTETYGGGRFVYATPPAAGSDAVVLDFNRAYNPPCVFTHFATCPLPPPGNTLALAVTAGEKRYGDH